MIELSKPRKDRARRRNAILLAVELPLYSHAFVCNKTLGDVLQNRLAAVQFTTVGRFSVYACSVTSGALVTIRALRRHADRAGASYGGATCDRAGTGPSQSACSLRTVSARCRVSGSCSLSSHTLSVSVLAFVTHARLSLARRVCLVLRGSVTVQDSCLHPPALYG